MIKSCCESVDGSTVCTAARYWISLSTAQSGRNSWCSGEMLRYHEELRLRRQLTGAQLTLKLESAGIEQD